MKSKRDLDSLYITKVLFGLRLTAVQLSDGSCGMASTIDDSNPYPCKKGRDFGDFSPSKYSGQRVSDLFVTEKSSGLIESLKIAVLNAISSNLREKEAYNIIEDKDPIDLIDLNSEKKITIVGAFKSYIELIENTNSYLRVLELDRNAFMEKHVKYYVPAEKYPEIIPDSDIVIITGLTLVNNTIDKLLEFVKQGATVVVTGPSANIVPEILFQNKVNIIGATIITDYEMLFKLVSEAGAAYHTFKYCAKKICIINTESKSVISGLKNSKK
ncbi:MAG TPA: DUF364 domain-containing protein [Bacteroidales bacterium]|nr:DUF364 domain-containing protein [Bacteroidales bacterium]